LIGEVVHANNPSSKEKPMSILLAEMTREQIAQLAPEAIAVLPTASIEQHGPHLPVVTDTLLCGTAAQRGAEKAAEQIGVIVTPVLCYGNSHHHRPFPGVLSLTSQTFMAAVTEVLEGLVLSGFRKLVVLNGHGGNTDSNAVVGLDFVNRLGQPVSIATGAYWDIARAALVEKGLIAGHLIPGHAGQFETALVMALRPDLVNQDGLGRTQDLSRGARGLFAPLSGATVQVHGAWGASPGYTDNPAAATPQLGESMLDVISDRVAEFLIAFSKQ
jgi:creatinine amidohydrolase